MKKTKKHDKRFWCLKGFCKEDQSVTSSLFTRDRRYSWLKMMIKRNLEWLLQNCEKVVIEGRGIKGKTKTNAQLRCKDQKSSPRGTHTVSPWRFSRSNTNVCWNCTETAGSRGKAKAMIDISLFSHGDMITRFNSPFFVLQVLSPTAMYLLQSWQVVST